MATKNPQPPKPAQGLPNGYVSKGGPESYDAHDNFQPTANYISKEPRAFHVRVHVNNDRFEPGKKMTVQVNKVKTFENFLEECTEKMKPAFGAARRLYTARGRHRIQNLEELTEDSIYVITGNETFKKHNYREIPEKTRPPHRKGYKKIDYDVTYTPVQHAIEERLRHKSGRSYYLNEHRRGLRLRVHINGENEKPYCPVSIRYKDRENFVKILEEIERTLQLQPIEKIYKVVNQGGYAENFVEITDAEHLEQDEHVLVLPKNEKKLQSQKIYHLDGKKNFRVRVSPRHGPAYNYPSFPEFDAGFKHNKSLNKHRPLPSIGSSTKGSEPISPFSNPPNSQGSRNRSKGRGPKQADYDQDAGGVYRAKKQNNAKGAAMVNETKDTQIERPIDQMDAEVVDEEEDIKEKITPIPPGTELNKQPSKELKNGPKAPKELKNSTKESKSTTKEPKLSAGEKKSNTKGNNVPNPEGSSQTKVKEDHSTEEAAAVKIQAGARGYMERKKFKQLKAEVEKEKQEKQQGDAGQKKNLSEDEAATIVQASFKGYKTRKDLNFKKQQVRDGDRAKNEAAVKIQSGFRGYLARKELRAKKVQSESEKLTDINDNEKKNDEAAKAEAAVKIQSSYRGFKTRKELHDKKKEDRKELSQDDAATTIQANYRGYKTRKDLAKKKSEQPLNNQTDMAKQQNAAAVKILANYKGYLARKEYKQKKEDKEADAAASNIQAAFKGYKVRKEQSRKNEHQLPDQAPTPKPDPSELDKAATKIQSGFRGYKTRKELKSKVIGEEIVETDMAQLPESERTKLSSKHDQSLLDDRGRNASKIQNAFRMFREKKRAQLVEKDYKSTQDAKNKIIAGFNGYVTRKLQKEVRQKTRSQTNVQAQFRGFIVRHSKVYSHVSVNELHAAVRGYVTRKLNNVRSEAFSRLSSVVNGDQYATVIQSLCKAFITRRSVKLRSEKKRRPTKSASSLQGPTELSPTKSGEISYWQDSNIKMYSDKTKRLAAARIQSAFHACKLRDGYQHASKRQVSIEHTDNDDQQPRKFTESQITSATKINAYYKGYQVRKISQAVAKHGLTDEAKVQEEGPMEIIDLEEIKDNSTEGKERLSEESGAENNEDNVDPEESVKSVIQVSFDEKKKVDNVDQQNQDRTESKSLHENEDIIVDDETKIRTSTRLSGPANSLKSESITFSDLDTRKGSGKSSSTWKSQEKVKAQLGEVELEGESAREIEDDAGELSSIEKNVKAVSQLQAAFRACRFRRELRREISELNGGGSELMDIKNVDRAVSALRKDFHLRSAKVRRLGSYQFGRERSPRFGKNWWEDSGENEENVEVKEKMKAIGGDDSALEIQDEHEKHENENGASRVQASAKAYFARKEHRIQKNRSKAKNTIIAVYKGYVTRKTALRIKSAQSRRSGSGRSSLSSSRVGIARARSAGRSVIIKSARTRASPSSQRTVFHVQMHSDVIQERVTRLQAAFAGYQTRKVHIALSKIMAESANDHNSSNQMERMGSLSETDDFKLRHKSIAKIQALESQRLQQEKGPLHRRSSIPRMGKRSPNTLNPLSILPPIGHTMAILEERSLRPKSGVSLRSQTSSISITEGKSKTQPNLFSRQNGDSNELKGIEMYIQKKIAATLLQAYARAWFTRQKYKTGAKRPANQQAPKKDEIHDTSYSSQKSAEIVTAEGGSNNKRNKKQDLNKSDQSVKSNGSVTSDKSTKRKLTDSQKERKSPVSVSSKSSKVTFKSTTSKLTKDSTNTAKEEMTEMVRHRTASVKLEAERRKLMAEKIRLQRDANEDKIESPEPQGKAIKQKSPVQPESSKNKGKDEQPDKVINNKTDINLDKDMPNGEIEAENTENMCYQGHDAKQTIPESLVLQTEPSDINETSEPEGDETQEDVSVNNSLFGRLREPLSPILSSRLQTGVDFDVSNVDKTAAVENEYAVNITPETNEFEVGVKTDDQTNAAIIIQKHFRGYRARKSLVKKQKSTRKLENEYKDWKSKRIEAAIAIQSAWRGYSVRKDLTDKDEATVEGFIGFENEPKGLIVIHIGRSKSEIKRSNRRYDNCSMIQLVYRACNVRRNFAVKGAVRRQEKNKAATRIQALYRAFLTRKNFKKHTAATRIQNVCKAYLTRVANEEKKKKLVEDQKNAATYLQAAYRSFTRRRQNEAEKEDRKINRAALDIQSVIRAFVVRWELGKRQERLQLEAADKLQQSARGYMLRKQRRIQKEKVSIITAAFRSFKARQQVQAYLDKLRREKEAATQLQATYRAFVTRRTNKEYKDRMARENLAASKILCSYRGMKARRMYRKLKTELARKREKAALKIQANYRGYKGRMVVRKAKDVRETHEMVVDLVDLVVHRALDYIRRRNISAERIQATVKGYDTRQEIMARLTDEAKLRGKQMQVNAKLIQAVVQAKQVRDRQNRRRREIEMNNAAVKIQSLYRGYRTRKAVEEEKEMLANLEPPPSALISARTTSGKLLSISVDEVLLKNSRAIIIFHRKASELQAAFRARKVREGLKDRLVRKSLISKQTPRRVLSVSKKLSREDVAAILIQKTFKGYYCQKTYVNAMTDRKKKWNRCADVIHAAFRGHRERTIERKKALKFGPERVGEILIAKYHAANVIAAAYRGLAHRKQKKAQRAEM